MGRAAMQAEPAPLLFDRGIVAPGIDGGFFVNNYPFLMARITMGRTMTFAIKAVKVAMEEE